MKMIFNFPALNTRYMEEREGKIISLILLNMVICLIRDGQELNNNSQGDR